jgi:hypothetical protein
MHLQIHCNLESSKQGKGTKRVLESEKANPQEKLLEFEREEHAKRMRLLDLQIEREATRSRSGVQTACTLIENWPFLFRNSSALAPPGDSISTCVQSIAPIIPVH